MSALHWIMLPVYMIIALLCIAIIDSAETICGKFIIAGCLAAIAAWLLIGLHLAGAL